LLLSPAKTGKPKKNPTRKRSPDVSVVVATKDRSGVLVDLIRSLARQKTSPDKFEILILDNGSRDDTSAQIQRLRKKLPDLQLHYSFLPVANASLARNEGARQARGQYLAFLDDDCRVPPDWMQRALKGLRQSGVRALGGPALVPNSKIYPRWFRGDWEDLKHPIHRGWLGINQYLFEGNFFIRRLDYLTLGGMKTAMGPSGRRFAFHEGTELQNRIRQRWPGTKRIYYDAGLAVSHLIHPGKVRLRNRWKRMLLAGLDHPQAHAGNHAPIKFWKIPALAIRAAWRGIRVGFNLAQTPFHSKRHWRSQAYNRTAREIYRLGETLGSIQLPFRKEERPENLLPSQTNLRSLLRRPFLGLWRTWQKRLEAGTIPLRVARSTPGLLASGDGTEGEIIWSKPGETNRLHRSRGSGTRHHPLLASEGQFHQPRLWLAKLPQATVHGPSVAVVTNDRTLLADVSIEWSKDPEDHGIMRKFFLPKPTELPGTSFLLASTGGNTFHHWMIDVIPRLMFLEHGPGIRPNRYLVNGLGQRFQRESLELLQIPASRCVALEERNSFCCETLLLPSLPCSSGHPSRAVCNFLRKAILPPSISRAFGTRKKILVGRSDTISRQATYWKEIRTRLLAESFEEILPSRMSLQEQAAAFHGADWVVGIHGAALTNLVFCRPGTKVVELFGWNYVNPCYRDLCSVVGLEHHGVVARGPGEGPEIVFELHDASGPIHVEPEQVLEVLKEAGLR